MGKSGSFQNTDFINISNNMFDSFAISGTVSRYFYWDIYGDETLIGSITGSSTSAQNFSYNYNISTYKKFRLYMRNNALNTGTYLLSYTLS